MNRKKKEKNSENTNYNEGGKKKRDVGNIVSICLMVVALCVFVGAAYMLYGYYKDYKEIGEIYDDLASRSEKDEDETEDLDELEDYVEENGPQSVSGRKVKDVVWDDETLTLPTMRNPIDFDALEAINNDIVGWLKIRALDLSYPVVQGEDNEYYLHNSFEKEYLFAGCLFVHFENKGDFTDKNTVIYGHNMKNGSMFGSLKNFRDEDVYNKSKYFWIFTKDIIYQYRIISARVVEDAGSAYQMVFRRTKDFQDFLDEAMENSEVDNSMVSVSTDDRIVTLSTCTGDSATRFIVQGKLVQMFASADE